MIWLKEKWENRIKRGDRVFVTLKSGSIYTAKVTGRCWLVPSIITVTIDEFPTISNIPFDRNELRRIP